MAPKDWAPAPSASFLERCIPIPPNHIIEAPGGVTRRLLDDSQPAFELPRAELEDILRRTEPHPRSMNPEKVAAIYGYWNHAALTALLQVQPSPEGGSFYALRALGEETRADASFEVGVAGHDAVVTFRIVGSESEHPVIPSSLGPRLASVVALLPARPHRVFARVVYP